MRTEKGVEIDLILKKEGLLYPYEVKSSMTPNKEFTINMKSFCEKEANAMGMCVIYCGESYDSYQSCRYVNYLDVVETIRQ